MYLCLPCVSERDTKRLIHWVKWLKAVKYHRNDHPFAHRQLKLQHSKKMFQQLINVGFLCLFSSHLPRCSSFSVILFGSIIVLFSKYFVQLIIDKQEVEKKECLVVDDTFWRFFIGHNWYANKKKSAVTNSNTHRLTIRQHIAVAIFKTNNSDSLKFTQIVHTAWIFANIMCNVFLWLLLNLAIIWNVKLSQTLFSFRKHETMSTTHAAAKKQRKNINYCVLLLKHWQFNEIVEFYRRIQKKK